MILLAQAVLILWIPAVLFYFAGRPPRRAAIVAFIVGWLFLPNQVGFSLPGFPDYDKLTATTVAVMLGILVFDPARLLSVRPRPADLPLIVWCVCPFFSSISSSLGPYEGLSAMLAHLLPLGLPYLIGRMYLADREGIRQLAIGLVIGGLVYVPLCLFEVRMSPVIEYWVYGLVRWEGTRYGGFRPKVFLASGLELGTWMTNATLVGFWLWFSGSAGRILGYPVGRLTLVLLVTSILCKSTGAGVLMAIGMATLCLVRLTGRSWPAWILILIPPSYEVSRTTGLWTGREAVNLARSTFGPERAQSLEFRLDNEDMLIARAMKRPLLGYGRFGGFQQDDGHGKAIQVLDGYWIISLGIFGIVGMASLTATWLLALVLLIRRQPAATWSKPEAGAAAVLSLMLALYMIDNLSNAMPNPIYGLALGGLVGLPSGRKGGALRRAESRLAVASGLASEGRPAEAEHEYRRAIEPVASATDPESRRLLAEALGGLGRSLLATGRPGEAELALRDSLELLEGLADDDPDPATACDLAIARESLGRALAELGRAAEAIRQRRIALRTWDELAVGPHADPGARGHRVDALNDLAWLLATDPDPALRDPAGALALAEEAALASSNHPACWNTLGVARYRAGDWAGAIEVLARSTASESGGTAFDYFFLAMASWRLGDRERARHWFDRAVAWSDRHRPGHPALARFRDEAAGLMAGPERAGVREP